MNLRSPLTWIAGLILALPHLARGAEAPRVWAVVIGIDDYQHDSIPDNAGARGDAVAIRRWLVEVAGWDAGHVLLMTDGAALGHGAAAAPIDGLLPTRANLEWALSEWLDYRARPDDIILVYYAGQAIGLGPGAKRSARNYLLPIDADPNDWDASGWSIERAIDARASRGANPIVLWLDCSPQGRGRRVTQAKDSPGGRRWLETIARWPDVTAWLATSDPPADDGDPKRRSPFVAALLANLGTKEAPATLLACLAALNRDRSLASRGFRSLGGVPPELSLWKSRLAPLARPPLELLLQQGHADRVVNVAVSPDGEQFFTAGMDATVKIWRTSDRKLLRALPYHTIGVTGLAISPDGRRFASADLAGSVWCWDLATHRAASFRGVERPHKEGIARLEFLADGSRFATLDLGGKVALWEVKGDDLSARLATDGATALAAHRDRLAVAGTDPTGTPWIRLFPAGGSNPREFPPPEKPIAPKCLALSDRFLAYGDRSGRIIVADVESQREDWNRALDQEVGWVSFSPSGLIVGTEADLRLLDDKGVEVWRIPLQATPEQLSFSPDGLDFTVLDQRGTLSLWSIDADSRPRPTTLTGPGAGEPATSAALAPGGRFLVVGGQDGTIRGWDLPEGSPWAEVPRHRGQVAGLAVSGDGRFLLQITRDGLALRWDLQEGRRFATLDGQWTSALFLPLGAGLAMTDRRGDVLVSRRASPPYDWLRLRRPRAEGSDRASGWGFGRLAASSDGRYVAAASHQGPLACVWELPGGQLHRIIRVRDHIEAFTGVDFTADSARLVTTSDAGDGAIRVWDMKGNGADPEPSRNFRLDDDAVTACRCDPADPRRLVTGHRNGRVVLWRLDPGGGVQSSPLKGQGSPIHTVAFAPDGRSLIASGADKAVWLWRRVAPGERPRRLDPPHREQVQALAYWPDGQRFASGGDDGEVRLWSVPDGRWRGSLAPSPETGEWVVFTPDGRFDSSPGAERAITWFDGRSVFPLDQFEDRLRHFRLADDLRRGVEIPESFAFRHPHTPPRLSITRPAASSLVREIDLEIAFDGPDVADFRLYQDDFPIRDGADLMLSGERRGTVRVALRKGRNRFYAMSGRTDGQSLDGRSNEVTIRFDGEETPGRLHALALGIGRYPEEPLRFAEADAKAIVRALADRPADTIVEQGRLVALSNEEVTTERVETELARIRREARPEDTIVLFLAGHSRVLPISDRETSFGLLLANAAPPPGSSKVAGADVFLPYGTIYKYLARMQAQRRLVVIDACRAGAALDDPAVRRINERIAAKVDEGASRARSAYILASRGDEDTPEIDALGHGLLTHVLLLGIGAAENAAGGDLALPNADFDKDGIVSSSELQRYTEDALPALASRFADLSQRARGPGRGPRPGQLAPHLQEAESRPFPLVRLPR